MVEADCSVDALRMVRRETSQLFETSLDTPQGDTLSPMQYHGFIVGMCNMSVTFLPDLCNYVNVHAKSNPAPESIFRF